MLEATAASLRQISNPDTTIVAIPTDITVESEVEALFAQVRLVFGRTADVVIANAGLATDWKLSAADSERTWWSNFVSDAHLAFGRPLTTSQEVNVRGLRNTIAQWILSQETPESPTGTVINVNTGLTGLTIPGCSGYAGSKLAAHRYMEFIDAGRPSPTLPYLCCTDTLQNIQRCGRSPCFLASLTQASSKLNMSFLPSTTLNLLDPLRCICQLRGQII